MLRTERLDEALNDTGGFWADAYHQRRSRHPHQNRRWVDRVHGLVTIAAPPPVLREWAMALSAMGQPFYRGTDHVELDRSPGEGYEGEVQILEDFAAQVSRAAVARERLFPGRAHQELTEEERAQVWRAPASAEG